MLNLIVATVSVVLSAFQSQQMLGEAQQFSSSDPYLEMSAQVAYNLRIEGDSLSNEMVMKINDVVLEGISRSAAHNQDFQADFSPEGIAVACFLERYLGGESESDLSNDARGRLNFSMEYLAGVRLAFESAHPRLALRPVCNF